MSLISQAVAKGCNIIQQQQVGISIGWLFALFGGYKQIAEEGNLGD